MADVALLTERRGHTPRAVQLSIDEHALHLSGSNDFSDTIPYWKLFQSSSGPTQRIRRVDRRGWELRFPAGGHHDLMSLIGERRLSRAAGPIYRLSGLKVGIGAIVLAATLAESVPARWLAALLPQVAQDRMVEGYIDSNARIRCNREGGEEAARKILTRLDPKIGRTVEIVTLSEGSLMVTALPGHKLLILRGALGDIDAEALAALVAHELVHLRHGDAVAAMVRYEGATGTVAAILEGQDRRTAYLEFSGEEEERADHEAIAMMNRAGVTMKPAATMFQEMRTDEYFARRQRDFHFGMPGRATAWAAAAASQPTGLTPLLTQDEADNLFNYCWPGRIKSYPDAKLPSRNLEAPLPAGSMKLAPADKQP